MMSLKAKKKMAALVLVAPLTLVACGSDADSTTESTSASSSTITSTKAIESTTAEESSTIEPTEATETTETTEPSEPEVAPETTEEVAAAPEVDVPLAEGSPTYDEAAPIESGSQASEADRAEIEALIQGIYQSATIHEFISYIPQNSCRAVLEANGGEASLDLTGIADMPLNEYPAFVEAQPHVASIEDVQVNGDQASAVVTAVSSGQAETRTQRFLREDGQWTFCN
ncbi:hypothetical protein C5L39_03630 [Corynebacterium alimapuense]|uniref:DUF4878 domain-containing protein n=2 Tax=Corynebacterium alimapuense TaxID=1576874 RepID=A0A3M8KAG8_9CORY|nr:hypothetical protein C5L39_03630 [Corynebacterium alimapuense]